MNPETEQPVGITREQVQARYNFGRFKVYSLLKNDPTFPRPRRAGGKRAEPRWDVNELDEWWRSLPRS